MYNIFIFKYAHIHIKFPLFSSYNRLIKKKGEEKIFFFFNV